MGVWKLLRLSTYPWNHSTLTVYLASLQTAAEPGWQVFHLWPTLAICLPYDQLLPKCPWVKCTFSCRAFFASSRMFHGICEVANTIIHLQINEGLSSLALHFTFFTRHRERSKTFPCIFMFFQEVKSKHDLVFVSFVSAYRMNISQRSRCLKRIWRMRWACTTRWRPRPRTTRRSRTCSNWRPPTGGSCFFKPSMFCGFGFFLFIRLQSITMFRERESGSAEEMFWVGVKIIGYIRETASCLGKLEWEIETLGPSSCFCKGALWLLLSHLPSLELCILVNKIQGLYTQWVK